MGAGGAGVEVAVVVGLTLAETVALLMAAAGVSVGVADGAGIVTDVGVAVAVGSNGIAVPTGAWVHAVSASSITRGNFIKRCLFQVIQRPSFFAGAPVTDARLLCHPF